MKKILFLLSIIAISFLSVAQIQPKGGITGTGTANTVMLWNTSKTAGNSVITQSVSNIGIGITPVYKLDVNGPIRASNSGFLVTNPAGGYFQSYGGSDTWNFTKSGLPPFLTATFGDYKMTTHPAYKFGIGNSSPGAQLHVSESHNSSSYYTALFSNSERNIFSIRSDGKFGINTVTPNAVLDIQTTAYGTDLLSFTNLDGTIPRFLMQLDASQDIIFNSTNAYYRHKVSGTTVMNITNTGVGIGGNFDPSYKLEVHGNSKIDGILNLPTVTNGSPTDGDIWNDGTHLYFRIGGVSKQLDN